MAGEFEPRRNPSTPANDTPDAANLLDRAQSGDLEAVMALVHSDQPIIVRNMSGNLAEFDAGSKQGVKGAKGK